MNYSVIKSTTLYVLWFSFGQNGNLQNVKKPENLQQLKKPVDRVVVFQVVFSFYFKMNKSIIYYGIWNQTPNSQLLMGLEIWLPYNNFNFWGHWSGGRISWDRNSFFHEVKIRFVHEIKIHNNIFTILIRRSNFQSWDQNSKKHY